MATAPIQYHLALLGQLRTLLAAMGETEQIAGESHQLFLERLDELTASLATASGDRYPGQELLCQVFQRYPQIAHLVPRELLWFFGGDCLHFMPDEEISLFQLMEERRFAAEENGEAFDWPAELQQLVTRH